MALNYKSVTISSVAGDGTIDENEANTVGGFTILGSGSYTGSENLAVNQTVQVTVSWNDINGTHTQTINAIILSVNTSVNPPTFTWQISESEFSSTSAGSALTLGNDTVTVTFGTKTSDPFDITYACFHRGTRVLTRHGYCPVEELAVGDELRTLQGGWQPLRWIGRQRITSPFGRAKSAPVRITAGAFGPSLPERDVWVSAGHAIFFRNHLIPAVSLVNGVTVFYDTEIKDIEYFHLLLDRHEVIFSEGLATESYVPCENIDWFDNTSECPERLLNAIRAGTAQCLRECYPRRVNGPVVETARALLARFVPADVTGRAVG